MIDGPESAALGEGFDAAQYGASGIAGEYDEIYAAEWDTANAVACLVELADGRSLLEFGIGTGRLAVPLAAAGLDVTGIDGSPEMVQVLRGKPGGDRIPVVIGDFASADAGTDFGVVVLAVNTIFALPDQEAQVGCFVNAARHLRPGGLFVIEAWVPDLAAFHRNRLVRQRILDDRVVSIESARLEPAEQRMRTTQVVLRNGSVRLYPANHRYAWPAELDLMARLAGMQRVARWSDWTRAEFGDDSPAHVSVYERHDVTA